MAIIPDNAATGSTRQHSVDIVTPSLEGLAQVVTYYMRKIRPSMPPLTAEVTSESEEDFFRSYVTRNGRMKLPMLRVARESISKADNALNRHVMATDGIRIGTTQDRAHTLMGHFYPMVVQGAITLYTDDFSLADVFIQALMMVEGERIEYNIDIANPKFSFPIRIVFSDTMEYPQPSNIEPGGFKGYATTSSLGMRTWIGMIEPIPNIETVTFQPVISTGEQYESVVQKIDDSLSGAADIEPWSPDQLTFTVNLNKGATSDTND